MVRLKSKNLPVLLVMIGLLVNLGLYVQVGKSVKRAAATSTRLAELVREERDLTVLENSYGQIGLETAELIRSLPADSAGLAGFLESVERTATNSGVVVKINIEDGEVGKWGSGEKRQGITIEANGSYEQSQKFINGLFNSAYYLKADRIEVKPKVGGGVILTIKLFLFMR